MFKVLKNGIKPTKGLTGLDLYASKGVVIGAGETKVIGLGICIDFDKFINKNKNLFEMNFYEACEDGDDGSHHSICGEKVDYFINSHYLELYPQDNLRAKGLVCSPSIIDLGYEGEIKIIVHNPLKLKWWNEKNESYLFPKVHGDTIYAIKKGGKIAQILLKEHKSYLFHEDKNACNN